MNFNAAEVQFRTLVTQVVNDLVNNCTDISSDKITERWFCEQLFEVVELNLLTTEEISKLFGWDDITRVNRLYEWVSSKEDEKYWSLVWPKNQYVQRVLLMAFGIAFKYKLSFKLEFSSEMYVPVPQLERLVPEPLVPWHIPLLELGWFEEVPKSAQRSLTAAGVVTLGQLLIKSEDEAYEIIHAYNTVARIRNILKRQGLEFASVTDEDYQLYMSHRVEASSADE